MKPPRLALLGTDCAVGKRTTGLILREACRVVGMQCEMVYTGQTGWLQGLDHGFILDATPNDFVSGEMEDAILRCTAENTLDVVLIEGQSSLRNPSGPCGAELLLSADAKGAILQHVPGREHFEDLENVPCPLPPQNGTPPVLPCFRLDTSPPANNQPRTHWGPSQHFVSRVGIKSAFGLMGLPLC